MEEIVNITLDNEMDLILAHKRTMKLGEMCGLSLPAQTTFATAVSEVARSAIGYGKNSKLVLSIDFLKGNRKQIAACLHDTVDLHKINSQSFSYAKRLMGEIDLTFKSGVFLARLNYRIPFSGTISPARIAAFKHYFKTETPLSPYDEIRKKNIQLLDLTDKIRESENQYRLLTDTLPLMMFAINNMDEITFSNKWLNDLLGMQPTAGSKMSWRQMLHPDDYQAVWPEWERALTNKTPFKGQGRLKHKDSYLWHLISMVPIKNEKDMVMGWIGFFVDIHAQKLVEDTLKDNRALKEMQAELLEKQKELQEKNVTLSRQNHFIETVIDASVDYIAVVDKDERFVTFNHAYEKLTGKKKEEVIGKPMDQIFSNIRASSSYDAIQKALGGAAVHDPIYHSNYSNRFYETFYVPLKDDSQQVYGVVILAHDITERIENEHKLKGMNEELIQRNSELEQFAYVASHDLQEPLRKIKTFSIMLDKELDLDEKHRNYFDKIISSTDRMTDLIRDILNYSRLSRSDERFEPTDLNTILANVLSDFEVLIREKGVSVISEKLPVIKCIPLQVSQLFSNILSNSIKFSSGKPVVKISTGKLSKPEIKNTEGLDPTLDYHHVTFKDNGIGFAPEFKDKIFVIFQRLHPKHTYGGTGIGLAICKRVVENHHGHISVSSQPDKGAAFRIVLPEDRKTTKPV